MKLIKLSRSEPIPDGGSFYVRALLLSYRTHNSCYAKRCVFVFLLKSINTSLFLSYRAMLAGENLRKSTSSPMCARTVTVNIKSRVVSVTGPRGTLKRSFKHQSFDMFVKDKRVYVEVYFGDRETRSVVRTIVSHIRNMMTGVTKVRKFSFLLLFAFASQ